MASIVQDAWQAN